MKITNLKCAVIGGSPIVRITTDEGIDGLGQGEFAKPYLKPHVLFYRDYILGEDPTDVQRVMNRIRRLGGFKPWGTAVSAIEVALWDIAGKHFGVPSYQLLGGRVRDKARVYYHVYGNTREKLVQGVRDARAAGFTAVGHLTPVSYTHLTLPTNREV